MKVFGKMLCLSFADVINVADNSAFSKDIAEQIAKLIAELPKQIDTLFVCCDSGESRSTAMAAAIMRYNGLDEIKIWKNPHYHPNSLVYSLLCKALGVPVSEVEMHAKQFMNEQALSDAVNQN